MPFLAYTFQEILVLVESAIFLAKVPAHSPLLQFYATSLTGMLGENHGCARGRGGVGVIFQQRAGGQHGGSCGEGIEWGGRSWIFLHRPTTPLSRLPCAHSLVFRPSSMARKGSFSPSSHTSDDKNGNMSASEILVPLPPTRNTFS